MALQLMFLIAEYMQLVGKQLDSPEVILSLFFFNSFPTKVSGNPTSLERQLRYLNHTILYLYCTYAVPILYLYLTYTIAYLFPCAIVSTL